mgnify:CR=1 FL=1
MSVIKAPNVVGKSRTGYGTSLYLPDYKVCFDVGTFDEELQNKETDEENYYVFFL